jgi:hypothetical protein
MDLRSPNFRSESFFLAQRSVKCHVCEAQTRVVALGLPVNHEVLQDDEDDAGGQGGEVWQTVAANALLFHCEWLPKSAQARLREWAPGFGLERCWSNHCEHCGTPLDDEALHCEAGDTFVPMTEQEGSKIRLIEILEPFEAWAGGYSLDVLFLPFPRRA